MTKIISEKKLENIFNHYKKQYNLNTELDILREGLNCYYSIGTNYIFFGVDYVVKAKKDLEKRSKRKDEIDNILFALLHEIKHSIEYNTDREKFEKEFSIVNIGLYNSNDIYHHSRPFEKRADNFARRELKRWLK